jgi:hypothetical protein
MTPSRNARLLTFALIAIGIGMVLTFSGVWIAHAQGGPTPTPTLSPTPITRAEGCAQCHLNVVADWQNSAHARAYTNAAFADSWAKTGNDKTCLGCHTTDFNIRTGEFAHEGVTCEACHGQTLSSHPPQAMPVNKGVDVCAGCHTNTVKEWAASKHGEQQLACVTCHLPHTQTLRFASTNELCLNCHKDQPVGYAHETHTDQQCTDCHWHKTAPTDLAVHNRTGALGHSGHEGGVFTVACINCHAELKTTAAIPEVSPSTGEKLISNLEARARVTELEAQVKSVQAQAQNNVLLNIVQGMLLGAVLGGAATVIVLAVLGRNERREDAK